MSYYPDEVDTYFLQFVSYMRVISIREEVAYKILLIFITSSYKTIRIAWVTSVFFSNIIKMRIII